MIETKDLFFTYPAEEGKENPPALRGVNIAIEKGSFTVVLGHNGSGKSTLAKTFNAVVLPSGGHVYVKGMVAWAKENAKSSGLENAPIRWIVDDCAKFVEREIRRGKQYDAIIMDPPSYGRGPTGEVWKLEENLYPFVELVSGVLSDNPLFVIMNTYTTGLAPSAVTYIMETVISKKFGGHTESQELGLPVTETGLALPCGVTTRWTAK